MKTRPIIPAKYGTTQFNLPEIGDEELSVIEMYLAQELQAIWNIQRSNSCGVVKSINYNQKSTLGAEAKTAMLSMRDETDGDR